jgi:hypothetical protein
MILRNMCATAHASTSPKNRLKTPSSDWNEIPVMANNMCASRNASTRNTTNNTNKTVYSLT